MKVTRQSVVALIAGLAIMVSSIGCSTTWVSQAEAIVVALAPAVTNILQLALLLSGKTVTPADAELIQKASQEANSDLQLIAALINQYNQAPDSQKADILGKIDVTIAEVQSSMSNLLPALHISDAATKAKIEAVVGVVLAEVQSLQALMPLIKSGQQKLPQGSLKRPLSAKEFKGAFNAVMLSPTGDVRVDHATKSLALK